MLKRVAAIVFIFLASSIAWLILGATIMARTNTSGERLRGRVQSIWGTSQTQAAPIAEYDVETKYAETVTEGNKQTTVGKTRIDTRFIRPEKSVVKVQLNSDPRKKGLLWYATYQVALQGEFVFRNAGDARRVYRIKLPFPSTQAIYDDLRFALDGKPVSPSTDKSAAVVETALEAGQSVTAAIGYRSQGVDAWSYQFGQEVSPVNDFQLEMTTNFRDIDFPDNTLSPATKRETKDGWQLEWRYRNLLSGYQISVTMPEKLQPGPLAASISFFAPVSLFFFFFLMFIITTLRDIELHPMNYFFLAAAFFAFHLLLAYLADHLDIHWSFAISAAVSVFLVVTYLRLVTGGLFAVREAALAQLIYLVLFSYAFFFKGLTGLAITIGSIVTLFVVMQMTGRIRWSEKFARRAA